MVLVIDVFESVTVSRRKVDTQADIAVGYCETRLWRGGLSPPSGLHSEKDDSKPMTYPGHIASEDVRWPRDPLAPLALSVSMQARKEAEMANAKTLPRFSIIPHENEDKCHTPDGKNGKV